MKKLFFLFLVFTTSLSFGQLLSEYKYVLVPKTFSFQKKEHQYNLNRLTQFLLNKYNFEAFIEGDDGLALSKIDPCEILKLKVEAKGVLTTKMKLHFINCLGKNIYTSREGISHYKEYKKSYTEALRNTFNDHRIKIHTYSKKYKKPVVVKKQQLATKQTLGISSNENFQLDFELRGKSYSFIPVSKQAYSIRQNGKIIGTATKKENSNQYTISAGLLSGKGTFDDYGNFVLKRINPSNKKEIIDTLVRTK